MSRWNRNEGWCWLVWGRTKNGFCELLAVCTSESIARTKLDYILANDADEKTPRLAEAFIEPREMDHAFARSMYGIGKLPRTRTDLGLPEPPR